MSQSNSSVLKQKEKICFDGSCYEEESLSNRIYVLNGLLINLVKGH